MATEQPLNAQSKRERPSFPREQSRPVAGGRGRASLHLAGATGSDLFPLRRLMVIAGESQTTGGTRGAQQRCENENLPARPIPVARVVTGGDRW